MKSLKKLLLVTLSLVLMLALCGAVLAAETGDKGESEPAAGDTTTTGAVTETEAAAVKGDQVTYETLDSEGNPIRVSGTAACSGSAPLYVNHDYTLNFKYYDTATRQTFDPDKVIVVKVETDSDCVTQEGNTIRLAASEKPYTFRVTVEMPDGTEASGDFGVNRFNFSILEIVIAFLGGYVIVSALRGRGSLFTDEFIKEEKKADFKRIMRIMAIVCGLALIASAVLTVCFSYIEGVNIARYICLGLAFVLLIGMAVVNSVMTDKEKRDKAQQTARTGGPTNSSAAFEFDGTEPTLDEVLADIENEKPAEEPKE